MHSYHQQMPLTLIPSRIANNLRVGGMVKTAHVKSTSAPKGCSVKPWLACLAWPGLAAVLVSPWDQWPVAAWRSTMNSQAQSSLEASAQ